MKIRFLMPILLVASGCALITEHREDVQVRSGKLTLRFDGGSGLLALAHSDHGLLLDKGEVLLLGDDRPISSADSESVEPRREGGHPSMKLVLEDGRAIWLWIDDDRFFTSILGQARGVEVRFDAHVGPEAVPGFLEDQKGDDCRVLITTLGPAEVPGAKSLFDPERDLALVAGADRLVEWRYENAWRLHAEADAGEDAVRIMITEDYYRKKLGVEYFRPMEKRGLWRTAPVVAMTWYGICGMKRPQDLDVLKPEIDWVAEHLLPYAGDLVFQLDDNYDHEDDQKMRALSDYIRGRGLVPGIWFTPYGVAPKEAYQEHPEWFLLDGDGKLIPSFGGVNWHWDGHGHGAGVINMEKEDAVENWFGMYWRKVSDEWNFDFFKIDGQPNVVNAYRRAANATGLESYRKGLTLAREIVGPDKFINGCWGMPIEGAGIMNGSRTGGDTGYWGHAVGVIISKNYLNNIVWWCDPDAAAIQFDKPLEVVRLNSQARALTGQQFLTDDMWTKVPPESCGVWQRSFPMLDIKPANLYPIGEEWPGYDLFDLRIAKTWGTYDVAGLFNYDERHASKRLDLSRLPLEAERVHVFEYWSSAYLGRFQADQEITFEFKPLEGRLFAVVPADPERPVLLSTNRHVSQGGLDLETVHWERHGDEWIVKGLSDHLVEGDPYELVFVSDRYGVYDAETEGGFVRVKQDSHLARVVITPEQRGSLKWRIRFKRIAGPAIGVAPMACDLLPDEPARIEITSLGGEGVEWIAIPSARRIRLEAREGRLMPWPERTRVPLIVGSKDLEPDTEWSGHVDFYKNGLAGPPVRLRVRLYVPPPENLALRAKASASSKWDETDAYHARRINDGTPKTRWNSARGDESGCWLSLEWPGPVTFDRIVIDECTEWGLRIRAWRVEAGSDALDTIARGETTGERHVIELPEPVTARTLKLILEEASDTPTIREVEVYLWKGGTEEK